MNDIFRIVKKTLAFTSISFFFFINLFFVGTVSVEAQNTPPSLSTTCNAANCTYYFLAPIEALGIGSANYNVAGDGANKYLVALYTFGIVIASALAVIMIVIGGVQYSSTDAISGKGEGKERIKAAITGLILALLSFTILRTLNVNLVNVSFSPAPIEVQSSPAVTNATYGAGVAGAVIGGAAGAGAAGTNTGANDLTNNNQAFGNTLGNGGVVTRFGGQGDRDTTSTETGSVSGELLDNLHPETDLYAAYPMSGHSLQGLGLPDYASSGVQATEAANRALNNQMIRVNLNNGTSINLRIVDRGPGDRNNFDVSGLADKLIKDGGGVKNFQLVAK